jgi:hypothetical protein
MRFSFKSFAIGFACAALSMGAVSYVNAAGDATIKSCANKKTGAMRYISKGKCKKTEKLLSWNQMGPTGLPGSSGKAGLKGDTGTAGTNGATGTNGTNGQNYYAIDATGKTLGPILGRFGTSVDVLIDNIIWNMDVSGYAFDMTQNGNSTSKYSDASCSDAYLEVSIGYVPNPQGVSIDRGSNWKFDSTDKAFRASGNQVSWTGRTIYAWASSGPNYVCTALSDVAKSSYALTHVLYSQTEVTKPTYTAPLTIVAK